MTAKHIRDEIDLAAWEMAEAESHRRRAAKLQSYAINRLARLSVDLKTAEEQIRRTKSREMLAR